MTIEIQKKSRKHLIQLSGECTIEEAETLLGHLEQAGSKAELDLKPCHEMHSAVLEVLMVKRPKISELPEDPFTRRLIRAGGLG